MLRYVCLSVRLFVQELEPYAKFLTFFNFIWAFTPLKVSARRIADQDSCCEMGCILQTNNVAPPSSFLYIFLL